MIELADVGTLYQLLLQDRKASFESKRKLYRSTLKKAEALLEQQPHSEVAKGMASRYGKLDRVCVVKIAKIREQLSLVKRGEYNDR